MKKATTAFAPVADFSSSEVVKANIEAALVAGDGPTAARFLETFLKGFSTGADDYIKTVAARLDVIDSKSSRNVLALNGFGHLAPA